MNFSKMAVQCQMCNVSAPNNHNFLTCSNGYCNSKYHYHCLGMKRENLPKMFKEKKANWKCMKCKNNSIADQETHLPKRILVTTISPYEQPTGTFSTEKYISSLPTNLCLKHSGHLAGGFEVWSLEDIPIGVRFGPYHETLIDINEDKQDFQWQTETIEKEVMNFDEINECKSNWLPYVNYACHEEEWNMITFCTESGLYYLTCRVIPANTELLVCDQEDHIEGSKGNEKNDVENTHQRSQTHENSFDSHEKGNLAVHKRIHTGEKPFECSTCGKKFVKKRNMTVHNRIHTGQKPFQCIICGKKFANRSNLIAHKKMHTGVKPFECTTCEKRFFRKSNLTAHKKTHTGERPFECSTCGKKFNTKGYLKVHKRIHSGEKPFECNACGRRFTTGSGLTVHKRTHACGNLLNALPAGKNLLRKAA